ncbi:MAG TPA: carbamoyltransferase HypF [Syntrophales bacterium]|nr:carbamoyltransferase HypF [Syntrophales bacterium]
MIKRARYLFSGVVQGVGFRPFIYRTAKKYSLAGFVKNSPDGVIVEVEGAPDAICSFVISVKEELPPLAEIAGISSHDIEIRNDTAFEIVESEAGGPGEVYITPDIATCGDCLKELFDPGDRRYRYPFINCTNCGPRLTIIRDIPYDRINTSMYCFPMCPRCQKEYEDPADRRFHAEPNACPVCGPTLTLLDGNGEILRNEDPLQKTVEILLAGHVVAIKGLGGFHLAIDAARDEAVNRLRSRKWREEKPLAVMVRDLETAARISRIGKEEEVLLLSRERPIVLARKKGGVTVSPAVAPGVSDFGIMLPYTPLHHMLLREHFHALVMTSANQVDEPICIENREAVKRLSGIADFFLVHNRDILVRCDDSIAAVSCGERRIIRRSRGFAPKPIALARSYPPVLALGPQLKTTLCILKGNLAFVSPHIGDMETPQARDFYRESLTLMQKIAECEPDVIACDLHPAYYTTKLAEGLPASRVIRIQHHHAHVVACMAENGIDGEVIGIAMDGTGYGADGTVWGGEFLVASESAFMRIGHLATYLLPGGEKAIREPWRIAVSLLREAYGDDWQDVARSLDLVPEKSYYESIDRLMAEKFNSPLTSSLGRLFDGVAAILGLRRKVSFEGQAAMELEAMARYGSGRVMKFAIEESDGVMRLDFSPMIMAITKRLQAGKDSGELAFSFHLTLQAAFCQMAQAIRKKTGLNRIVMSGGCFQNRILTEGTIGELKKAGFDLFFHRATPTNDGCISLGQAISAGARLSS